MTGGKAFSEGSDLGALEAAQQASRNGHLHQDRQPDVEREIWDKHGDCDQHRVVDRQVTAPQKAGRGREKRREPEANNPA